MKQFLIAISIILSNTFAFGQISNSVKEEVLAEIGKNDIEDFYLGCLNCISLYRLKADNLFNRLSLDTAIKYSKHESYTVKYYSFLRILWLDDTEAFNFVKENILDSTKIDIVAACLGRTIEFNQLISSEYKRYLVSKSKGLEYVIDNRVYRFGKSDRKDGKIKLKELDKLLRSYGFSFNSR